MKQFRIFEHPISGQCEVVKIGFSWPGCCFGFIWALVKKLYLQGGILLLVVLLLTGLSTVSYELDIITNVVKDGVKGAWMGLGILTGMQGNEWLAAKLLKKGFVEKETVLAPNPESALILSAKNAKKENA